MSRFNETKFLEKFYALNGDRYTYMGYENGLVQFYCKKHDKINYDTPSHLVSGRGCKECGKEKQQQTNILANKKAKDTFIERARKIHGDKYDYSKVNYINAKTKVCIICPIHGEFKQTPQAHLRGEGCRKCGIEESHKLQRKTTEQFIKEAREIHGDKYDYSKVNYVDERTDVIIVCPKHGEFKQKPMKHLKGRGCHECGIEKLSKINSFTTEKFIARAKEVHGDKYDYSKVEYKGYYEDVCIVCPAHGEFWQTPDSHLQGCGCQRCSSRLSKNEDELYNFISKLVGKDNVEKSNTSILPKHREIDIYVPSFNIGIEYNGCRWHSELFGKDKYYHINKTNYCKENGISLIHIFEDEYCEKKDIVLAKLKHLLKCDDSPKISGRKCNVYEIPYNEAKDFLDKNHLQGSKKSSIYLGASCNNELIGVMSFTKIKDKEWELDRFATNIKYICQGVGGKLFSFFTKKYNPTYIKSFADRRWTTDEKNNIYTKLGFILEETLKPDYRYVKDGYYHRIHKFNFRKQILHKKYDFDLSMTESEMAKKLNAYKIWDCGLFKYVWRKNNNFEI